MWWLLPVSLFVLPLYLYRFPVGSLPTNFLMSWLGFVALAWVIEVTVQKGWRGFWSQLMRVHRWVLVGAGLLQLGGLLGLVTGGFSVPKLGQYIVWFLEPGLLGLAALWWTQRHLKVRQYVYKAGLVFCL